jgi:hypothetical protein
MEPGKAKAPGNLLLGTLGSSRQTPGNLILERVASWELTPGNNDLLGTYPWERWLLTFVNRAGYHCCLDVVSMVWVRVKVSSGHIYFVLSCQESAADDFSAVIGSGCCDGEP